MHLATGDPISSCGTEIRVNKSSSQDFGEGVDNKFIKGPHKTLVVEGCSNKLNSVLPNINFYLFISLTVKHRKL